MFPESPRYNYSKEKFEKTKEDLAKIAKINGIHNYNQHNFVFDT